jgi:endonuclease/exonuclease/phosphatase family metal-dependent hydrolase
MDAEDSRIRALTWNVHGCVGRSGAHDHDGVMQAVRAIDADIVSLQEVDERAYQGQVRSGFAGLSQTFSESHSAEARTIRTADGDYGHILLSRWPIEDCEYIDLTVGGREPRMAISASINSPGGTVQVLSAHLGISTPERRNQLALVKDHLSNGPNGAAVVLGDFNEWRRSGAATRTLCPPFEVAALLRSFPSNRPLFALDRIWCRAPLEPVDARVAKEYRKLSDHLAVVAELRFKPATQADLNRRASAAERIAYQRYEQQHHKDKEQNLRDSRRRASDSAESESGSNECQ